MVNIISTGGQGVGDGYKGSVCGGARGVMVIVVGIEHDDTSSNPRRD